MANSRYQIVQCDRLSSGHDLIPFPVTSCSGYSDRRVPSIRDMEDIAWVLRTDPARNRIGFFRPHRGPVASSGAPVFGMGSSAISPRPGPRCARESRITRAV